MTGATAGKFRIVDERSALYIRRRPPKPTKGQVVGDGCPKSPIHYQYAETPNGGRVTIVTSDQEALGAVHAFLKYQIAEHKTGDPATVRPR